MPKGKDKKPEKLVKLDISKPERREKFYYVMEKLGMDDGNQLLWHLVLREYERLRREEEHKDP